LKEGLVKKDQLAYAERVRSKLEGRKTLLQVFKDLKYISDDQIRNAIRANRVSMKIGNLLLELGYISEADLQRAYDIQKNDKNRKRLGHILVEQNFIGEREILDVLSLQLRLLNRQNELLSLKEIGMPPRILERFVEQGLELPSGVLLITGPTRSGKTSTV
jgi:type IV pilus assembly protein PilB